MKQQFFTIVAAGLIAVCSSCVSSTSAVSQLRSLATDVQQNSAAYSLAEWQHVAKKYGKVEKHISKHRADYSAEQLKEIGTLRGQIISGLATGMASQAKGHIDEFGTTLSTILDQISGKGRTADDWRKILKPFVEQLESVKE